MFYIGQLFLGLGPVLESMVYFYRGDFCFILVFLNFVLLAFCFDFHFGPGIVCLSLYMRTCLMGERPWCWGGRITMIKHISKSSFLMKKNMWQVWMWVKCLLYWHLSQRPGVVLCTCNPSAGGRDSWASEGLIVSQCLWKGRL